MYLDCCEKSECGIGVDNDDNISRNVCYNCGIDDYNKRLFGLWCADVLNYISIVDVMEYVINDV